jgi:hypothetical protein
LFTDSDPSSLPNRGQPLDRRAHVIVAEMSIPLDHDLGFPAPGLLDRVEIDTGHRQPARERVPEIVKAEIWDLRDREGRSPVSLKVDEPLTLGRREHPRGKDRAVALDGQEGPRATLLRATLRPVPALSSGRRTVLVVQSTSDHRNPSRTGP